MNTATSTTNDEVFFPYRTQITYTIELDCRNWLMHKRPYWAWCSETLEIGMWKMLIGYTWDKSTYCFHNAEDFLAFKLRFGV